MLRSHERLLFHRAIIKIYAIYKDNKQNLNFSELHESSKEDKLSLFYEIQQALGMLIEKMDFSMFQEFIKEMSFVENAKKIDITDYKCLVSGYHREAMDSIKYVMIIPLNYLIEKYYYDDCKLIAHPQSDIYIGIQNNGQTATVKTYDNFKATFSPGFIHWNFPLDVHSSVTLRIKLKWLPGEGHRRLLVGYFHGKTKHELKSESIKYIMSKHDDRLYRKLKILSRNYEPLLSIKNKSECNRYMIKTDKHRKWPSRYVDLKVISWFYSSDTIIDIEYVTYCPQQQESGYVKIRHKGIMIGSIKLKKSGYILPAFTIISRTGGTDDIKIIQSYIKK